MKTNYFSRVLHAEKEGTQYLLSKEDFRKTQTTKFWLKIVHFDLFNDWYVKNKKVFSITKYNQ